MKCYVLLAFGRWFLVRLHRVYSANVCAVVRCEWLIFYPMTFGRRVIDLVVAEKDVAEFQFHRYCIHPMEMVCHRLNAVNHTDLACVCIHWMVRFESIKKWTKLKKKVEKGQRERDNDRMKGKSHMDLLLLLVFVGVVARGTHHSTMNASCSACVHWMSEIYRMNGFPLLCRTSLSSVVRSRCKLIFEIFLKSFHRSRAVFALQIQKWKIDRET